MEPLQKKGDLEGALALIDVDASFLRAVRPFFASPAVKYILQALIAGRAASNICAGGVEHLRARLAI